MRTRKGNAFSVIIHVMLNGWLTRMKKIVSYTQEQIQTNRNHLKEVLLREFPEHQNEIETIDFTVGLDAKAIIKKKSISKEFAEKIFKKFSQSIR